MSILVDLRELKDLSGAEKQARDYVLRHFQEIVEMDIRTAAKHSYTSPATFVRLSKRVGVKGFGELKLRLSSEIQLFSRLNLQAIDATNIDPGDSPEIVVNKLVAMTLLSIEETGNLLSVESLKRAASLMLGAARVDLYGVGASSLVAIDATYKFMRLGKDVFHYQLYDRQYVQAVNSKKDSVAVVISYTGETEFILKLVDILRDRGTPIIAITGNGAGALSRKADVNLYVPPRETDKRSAAMSSRISQLLVIDALYSVYMSMDYRDSVQAIRRTRVSGELFGE